MQTTTMEALQGNTVYAGVGGQHVPMVRQQPISYLFAEECLVLDPCCMLEILYQGWGQL